MAVTNLTSQHQVMAVLEKIKRSSVEACFRGTEFRYFRVYLYDPSADGTPNEYRRYEFKKEQVEDQAYYARLASLMTSGRMAKVALIEDTAHNMWVTPDEFDPKRSKVTYPRSWKSIKEILDKVLAAMEACQAENLPTFTWN